MFNLEKYKEIKDFIKKNKKSTKIIAISKNHSKASVLEAIKFGVKRFGENRVQEAKSKFNDIRPAHPNLELHLTGSLQTNKITYDRFRLESIQIYSTISDNYFLSSCT